MAIGQKLNSEGRNLMKKILSVLCSVILLIMAVAPVSFSAGRNLCKNGGFETDVSGWKATNASIQRTDKQAYTGSYSAKISVTSNYGNANYTYNFKKGVNYTISARIRMEEGSGEHFARFITSHTAYGDGTPKWYELARNTPVNDKEWSLITTSFCYTGTNKTGKGDIQIRIDDGTKQISFYMDDFTILSESNENWRETEYLEGEMIENRGFDIDTEGWVAKDATLARVAGEGYDNSEASALVETSGNGYVGQQLSFKKGQKYNIYSYVKTAGNTAYFNIAVKHSDSSVQMVALLKPTDGNWNKIAGEYTHNREDETATVYITSNNTKSYYFDDFSVIPAKDTASSAEEVYSDGVSINGIKTNIPYIKEGETVLCPAVDIAEKINASAAIYGDSVTVTRGINEIVLKKGSKLYTKNSVINKAMAEATVKDEKIYCDVRALCEGLGCKVKIEKDSVNISFDGVATLDNTARKLRVEKKLDIGFLTGSAPKRGGTVDPYTEPVGYLVGEWFKTNYPDSDITVYEDDATTSGSLLGAFRATTFVKDNGIDLLFVDLYRNDINESALSSQRYTESLVRSAKAVNPDMDIIFLYSLNEQLAALYDENKVPECYEGYEKTAALYSIPTLNIGKLLYNQYKSEGKNYSSYHSQNLNPNSDGTKFYQAKITGLLKSKIESADESITKMNRSQSDAFKTQIATVDTAKLGEGWRVVNESLSESETNSYITASQPGSEMSFEFTGNVIGIYYQSVQDAGDIYYSVDGSEYKELSTFDEWAYRYEHMKGIILRDDLTSSKHTLRIKVSGTKNINSMNTVIRIGGFLVGEDD